MMVDTTNWDPHPIDRAQIRHYAAALYALSLLIPVLQRHDTCHELLATLVDGHAGRRLASYVDSPTTSRTVIRALLDEAILLCRDDTPLLDLAHALYDILDQLPADMPDLTRAATHVSTVLDAADRP